MSRYWYIIILLCVSFTWTGCAQPQNKTEEEQPSFQLAAQRFDYYLPLLEGKKVGLLVNQTARIGETHLLDTLLSLGVDVKAIFAPEHGFRGDYDAGEQFDNDRDAKTGVPIVSLYGKNYRPKPEDVAPLDVVIFDIQDVGVRFYTYISSLYHMMDVCAETSTSIMVLDRPNPNGGYVDGPVLDLDYQSFVGIAPIPIVHGLTVGEFAKMVNGEGWLPDGKKSKLSVISMEAYHHQMEYELPIKPSPNLPNNQSIYLYPSLGLFDGTNVSTGRGTYFAFQVVGYPDSSFGSFSFTPKSIEGMAKYPVHQDKECFGVDLRETPRPQQVDLNYIISFYEKSKGNPEFFNKLFPKLAGNDDLQAQIEEGWTAEQIRATWEEGLEDYRNLRAQYLLYPQEL